MKITDLEAGWIRENIEQIDFLSCLDPQQIQALIENATPRLLAGNQPIIREGQEGHTFFFIYNGRVSVWIERQGKRTKLATLNRGDFFGEIALLTGKPASATVIANNPTKVFFLDQEHFISLVRNNEPLKTHIMNTMKKRLSEREEAVQQLQYGNMEEVSSAIATFLQNPPKK